MAFGFLKNLDADDIFISYSREDGETYLSGLAEALTKLGFSCFDDRSGTEAGRLPPETLFRKVRNCRTLVLLATPAAIKESEFLAQEVREFAAANRTDRIVAVSFDADEKSLDDWSGADWFELVDGKSRARELPTAIETGTPSAAVVSRIEKQSNYQKSKDRLRKYRDRALAGFLCLLVAGLGAGVFALYGFRQADNARKDAATARTQADATIAKANEDAMKAVERAQKEIQDAKDAAQKEIQQARDDARKEIRQAQDDAQVKILAADALTKVAEGERAVAEGKRAAAEAARLDAEAEAEHQQAIGDSRSLANRSQTLLRQRPDKLSRSVTLAVDAMSKSLSVGEPVVEADTALRESLALFPFLHRRDPYQGDIKAVALSPDGRHFATLSSDKTLSVYESDGQKLLKKFPCEGDKVALSSAALRAVVASQRGLEIYDVKSERLLDIVEVPGVEIKDLALSPSGRYLASIVFPFNSGHGLGVARLWDATSKEEIPLLEEHLTVGMIDVAFGPTGILAATGSDTVFWYIEDDPENGRFQNLSKGGLSKANVVMLPDQFRAVAPGADLSYFATDKAVWKQAANGVFEPVTRIPSAAGEAGEDAVTVGLALDLARNRLLVARRGTADVGAGIALDTLDASGHRQAWQGYNQGGVDDLSFAPGGLLVPLDWNRYVSAFKFDDGAAVQTNVGQVAFFAPGSKYFVTFGDEDNAVHVTDARGAEKITVRRPSISLVPALSPDGKFLVLVGRVEGIKEKVAFVYRRDGNAYKEWKKVQLAGPFKQFALTPDGRTFIILDPDRTVRLVDVESGQEVKRGGLSELKNVETIELSPEGRFLATKVWSERGTDAQAIRVWRLADGAEPYPPAVYSEEVKLIVFSPRERHLLTTGSDGVTRLLDLRAGQWQTVFEDITDVRLIVFSPDGRYLCVSSDEGLILIYKTDDFANEIARLPYDGRITAVAFSEDNKYVAMASNLSHLATRREESYPVRVWLLQPEDLLNEATKRLARLPAPAR